MAKDYRTKTDEVPTMPHDLAGVPPHTLIEPASSRHISGNQASNPAEHIRPLMDVEREAIENAIRLCRGNIPMAAVCLGLSPSTLYRKRAAWVNNDTGASDQ